MLHNYCMDPLLSYLYTLLYSEGFIVVDFLNATVVLSCLLFDPLSFIFCVLFLLFCIPMGW